jgi:ABC-type Mn2+/Zn2+ transport system ATPase subunit
MTNETIVSFNNVRLGYGRTVVLDDLNLVVKRGDFLGIIGPNGIGKTTLLKAILGLIRPISGEIVADKSVRFGYVMQRQSLDDIFPFTAWEVALMGRYGHLGPLKRIRSADRDRVEQSLREAGVLDLRRKLFRDLSGGQKQRVLIARALASDPDVLVLDEPTSDLDVKGGEQVMDLIDAIHRSKSLGVVLVSHLLDVVLNHVRQIMFLNHEENRIFPIEKVAEPGFLSHVYDFPLEVVEVCGKRFVMRIETNRQ